MALKNIYHRAWNSPTITTWTNYGARIAGLGTVVPLVLRNFSSQEIAVYFLLLTLIGLRRVGDFGFSTTFTRTIAYALGGAKKIERFNSPDKKPEKEKPNLQLLEHIVGVMRLLYNRMGIIVFLVYITAGTYAVSHQIAMMENPSEGWVAWWIVALTTPISFWTTQYVAYILGNNEVALIRRWEAIGTLLGAIFSIIAILAGGGLIWVFAGNQAGIIMTSVLSWLFSRNLAERWWAKHPNLDFHSETFRSIWPATWRSGLGQLMAQGTVEISAVIYSIFIESEEVIIILFSLRLIRLISDFSQAPFYSKLPLLSRLVAQGDKESIIRLSSKGMSLSYLSYVLVWIGAGLTGPWLFSVIDANVTFPPQQFWAILGFAYLIQRYGAMHLQLYSTTNHIVWHIANGISGILYICFIVFAFNWLGIYAIPVGYLFANMMFYSWYAPYLSYKKIIVYGLLFERKVFIPYVIISILYTIYEII